MKKKFGITILILVVISLLGYYLFDSLGGNNPVTISKISSKPDNLVGRQFIGTPNDERLGEIFREIETQKGLNSGTYLHTIYEAEPAGKRDTLKVFVGINKKLPTSGLEFREFSEDEYLLAKINASKWVMPSPNSVKEKLYAYAEENNLTLSGVFIDKIISEDQVQVIAPVK